MSRFKPVWRVAAPGKSAAVTILKHDDKDVPFGFDSHQKPCVQEKLLGLMAMRSRT